MVDRSRLKIEHMRLSLLFLLFTSIVALTPTVNQCSSDMKFCDDKGYFDPVIKQRLFEGSIALF